MQKKDLIIVKLGGSVVTDKTRPYKIRAAALKRLVKEIKKANVNILVVHGSGSFGHTSAKKYGGKKGYLSKYGIAKVSYDARAINAVVMESFLKEKMPAISLSPMSFTITRAGKLKEDLFKVVDLVLDQQLIPVIYGDVIWDTQWRSTIFSGETTTFYLIKYLLKNKWKIDKVIQVGVTDGVYDEREKTIELINDKNKNLFRANIFKSKGADVTGGMYHKVEQAMKISRLGIKTNIINGLRKNALYNSLLNRKVKGTIIE